MQQIQKTKGWKTLKIKVHNDDPLFDIAFFGENSRMFNNFQLCEDIKINLTFEDKQKIELKYGKELPHNFINDIFVIH